MQDFLRARDESEFMPLPWPRPKMENFMATEPAPPSRRRWLRWTIRIGLGLGFLVCVGVALVWFYLERIAAEGKKQLAAAIAETDALDPRWRWEEIQEDLQPIPDSENSMRVIRQVADSLQGWDATLTIENAGYDEYVLEAYPANRMLDDQRRSIIRKGLENRQASLSLAVSLKDFPRGRATIRLSPDIVLFLVLPHTHDCRAVTRLLELDIEQVLGHFQTHEAVDRIQAILHAGAGLRDDPSLFSQLVRMHGRRVAVRRTERLLGMADVGDNNLRRLIAHFNAERDEKPLLVGIRGERASFNFLLENLESGRVSLAEMIASGGGNRIKETSFLDRFAASRYHPLLYDDHAFLLVTMNEGFEIAQLPILQQQQAWSNWYDKVLSAKANAIEEKRKLLSFLLLPALDRAGVSALRDHASLSCVLAALAAERFRLAHKRWPKDLQELCPAYLKEVPIDLFDGLPLKFAQREDGIVIYSVGRDGKDDGGDIHKQSPDDDEPKDLGVRLWNPDHRRLPPLPKKEQHKDDDGSE
jgi:hypothetical protein